jgi:hypothetical protein
MALAAAVAGLTALKELDFSVNLCARELLIQVKDHIHGTLSHIQNLSITM